MHPQADRNRAAVRLPVSKSALICQLLFLGMLVTYAQLSASREERRGQPHAATTLPYGKNSCMLRTSHSSGSTPNTHDTSRCPIVTPADPCATVSIAYEQDVQAAHCRSSQQRRLPQKAITKRTPVHELHSPVAQQSGPLCVQHVGQLNSHFTVSCAQGCHVTAACFWWPACSRSSTYVPSIALLL